MKIKRFTAPSMREAMRLVRQEQGEDAVILGNRRVEGGVEVVAATDYDAALIQQASAAPVPEAAPIPPVSPMQATPVPRVAPQGASASTMPAAPSRFPFDLPASVLEPAAPQASKHEFDALKREMSGLRTLMQQHMAGLAWGELKTRNPVRADVLRQLSAIGVDLKLAREIAQETPDDTTPERAHHLPSSLLARRIPVYKHEWLEAGGVVALVGATGVGKTTTIAKLCARYVRDYGMRDVALVTTDHFRIGAQEQLFTYGRLLGVPVLTADNQHELCLALDKLKDRKLVLIDTAGISPRDQNLEKQFAMLSGLPVPNRTALVLGANSHGADLDAQVRRFARAEPSACILTKIDEATRIGAAISTLIRHGLPLAYTTDGQRVPEDLWAADADRLVLWAMQLSRRGAEPDDDELSLQMSGVAHA